ncbi:YeiH family protein [Thermomonas flagellata]|uniref:YeiH family protein n=1 Tax=Thermomonas flagellata TaxID=2888524 RepID=UPI001F039157|nr:putative sulfate exporter family transporter [Thermomonas flagellata]
MPTPDLPALPAATGAARARPEALWPGLLLSLLLAAAAFALGRALPLVGGAVLGIVLGLGVRNALPLPARTAPGIRFSSKVLLQAAVILLGFGLDLHQVLRTGLSSLAVTLVTLSVAFLTAWALARLLKVHHVLGTLIGVGTAICGGSAIAAVAPILRPDEHDTALAMSTIFLFNLVAVLLFPPLGHLLGLSQAGFGLWAGTAINDTSSVVAAGYHYGQAAGDIATVVKLARATLIIPICLALAGWQLWRARGRDGDRPDLRGIVPWFILGFLVASALRSAGPVPAALLGPLHLAAEFLIVLALTAIGLSADLRRMAATGARPLLLGLGTWFAVAASSLLVQALLHQS